MFLHVASNVAMPALAITIGARYFAFRTLYNEPLFWLLGALIAAAGMIVALNLTALPGNLVLVVGTIEVGFAGLLLIRWRSAVRSRRTAGG